MTRMTVIEDGMAKVYEHTLVAEAPLEKLSPHLLTPQPLFMPQLPRNTVAIASNPDDGIQRFVTELQPAVRTLLISTDETEPLHGDLPLWEEDSDEPLAFRVPTPYLYFLWTVALDSSPDNAILHYANLFWRPTRLTSHDDRLWVAAFPNVAENGEICWGEVHAQDVAGYSKLDQYANSFFGGSVCNADYGWRIPSAYGSFTDWAAAEPLGFVDWPDWNREPLKLTDLMNAKALPKIQPTTMTFPPQVGSFATTRAWFNGLDQSLQQRIAFALAQPINRVTAAATTEAADG